MRKIHTWDSAKSFRTLFKESDLRSNHKRKKKLQNALAVPSPVKFCGFTVTFSFTKKKYLLFQLVSKPSKSVSMIPRTGKTLLKEAGGGSIPSFFSFGQPSWLLHETAPDKKCHSLIRQRPSNAHYSSVHFII